MMYDMSALGRQALSVVVRGDLPMTRGDFISEITSQAARCVSRNLLMGDVGQICATMGVCAALLRHLFPPA